MLISIPPYSEGQPICCPPFILVNRIRQLALNVTNYLSDATFIAKESFTGIAPRLELFNRELVSDGWENQRDSAGSCIRRGRCFDIDVIFLGNIGIYRTETVLGENFLAFW